MTQATKKINKVQFQAAALIALALLLFACGQAPAATAVAPTAAPVESAGEAWVTFTGPGYEIDLPASFAGDGTELPLDTTIYSSVDGYTNVSMTLLALGGSSLEDIAQATIDEYAVTAGYTFLEEQALMGEVASIRLTVLADETISGGAPIVVSQYLVAEGDNLWLLGFGTTESSFADWSDQFDLSALSLHFTD
jgi:hypothetical protein